MAKQIIKCKQYDMFNTTPVEGQIYFCTDTRVLFKDFGPTKQSRLRLPAVILFSDYEREQMTKPSIGKNYYVEETNQLWLFDTRWNIIVGAPANYNAYVSNYSTTYNGEYISPVINQNEAITNASGDKIIDNNGLLGNGAVAIRDDTRIIRGLINSDNKNQYLTINSYLDNGILFIPNSHLPYSDLSTSLGALHLTIDRNINDIADNVDLEGQAYYYGNWNNFGDINIITNEENPSLITISDTPNINTTLVKIFISCTKTIIEKDTKGNDVEKKIKTYFVIRPITETQGIANIVSLSEEDSKSVVINDIGELLYTNAGSLEENKTVNCNRKIMSNSGEKQCIYTFENYDSDQSIILKQYDSSAIAATISKKWSDDGLADRCYMNVWTKKKVLNEVDYHALNLKISKLESKIEELEKKLNK